MNVDALGLPVQDDADTGHQQAVGPLSADVRSSSSSSRSGSRGSRTVRSLQRQADAGLGRASTTWPPRNRLAEPRASPRARRLLHPRCRGAGDDELRRVMSLQLGVDGGGLPAPRPPADWTHTDSWADAASIPNARVVDDLDGREAALFERAETIRLRCLRRAGACSSAEASRPRAATSARARSCSGSSPSSRPRSKLRGSPKRRPRKGPFMGAQ